MQCSGLNPLDRLQHHNLSFRGTIGRLVSRPLPGGGQEAGTVLLADKVAMAALWAFIAFAVFIIATH